MNKFLLVNESKMVVEESKTTALKKSWKMFQKYVIEPTGYRLSKVAVSAPELQIDLRNVTDNPIEAVYRAGHSLTSAPNKWVIINVPTARCRRFPMGFAVNSPHSDPFAETVRDYLNGSCTNYENSALQKYFTAWQPRHAAELLGLDTDEADASLLKAPAYGAVFPWDFDSAAQRTAMNQAADWRSSGPVTDEIGRAEFARFKHVADSVVRHGYHRNTAVVNGDIGAQVLAQGDDWRILICDGTHRFATLCGLGWKEIPVAIRRWPMIIRREEASSWPNVTSGLFTVPAALKVFDLFFNANQPAQYQGYQLREAQR